MSKLATARASGDLNDDINRDGRSLIVRTWNTSTKRVLFRLGTFHPYKLSFLIRKVADGIDLGSWAQGRGLLPERLLPDREALFDLALEAIAHEQVLYLEFGVYRGASLRYMARGLHHPDSRLIGFDSFEGLPQDWNYQHPAGTFSVGGQLPQFDDPRVSLAQGWFDETLPSFVAPSHERLFATFDADLYSSTLTALEGILPLITVGSYLYFDQFNDAQNELRAFEETLQRTGWRFRAVGASRQLRNWLFLRTA